MASVEDAWAAVEKEIDKLRAKARDPQTFQEALSKAIMAVAKRTGRTVAEGVPVKAVQKELGVPLPLFQAELSLLVRARPEPVDKDGYMARLLPSTHSKDTISVWWSTRPLAGEFRLIGTLALKKG